MAILDRLFQQAGAFNEAETTLKKNELLAKKLLPYIGIDVSRFTTELEKLSPDGTEWATREFMLASFRDDIAPALMFTFGTLKDFFNYIGDAIPITIEVDGSLGLPLGLFASIGVGVEPVKIGTLIAKAVSLAFSTAHDSILMTYRILQNNKPGLNANHLATIISNTVTASVLEKFSHAKGTTTFQIEG